MGIYYYSINGSLFSNMNILDKIGFIKKGVEEIIFEKDLELLFSQKKKLVIKVGFDPTSTSLHLGHLVLFRKLREFQELGYRVCILIGDFTAVIGDPSGKKFSRQLLTDAEVVNNYKTYRNQIFKILDEAFTDIFFNSAWLNNLSIKEFIKISSMSTVARMLERSDFKTRYEEKNSIGINEFLYPFLQAYDSVILKADIELGGIDQKFNLLLGRELQKRFGQKPQVIIMMPIINGLDGKKKMSKSFNNYIAIADTAYNVFCKIMSISDVLMKDYFVVFGFYTLTQIDNLFNSSKNLMDLKFDLAFKITSILNGSSAASLAKTKFIDQFCKKSIPNDIDILYLYINDMEINIIEVLSRSNLILSNSEAKRLLKSRAVKVNNVVIEDRGFLFVVNKFYIIQVGKLKFIKIFIKKV